jgi:hypothetical protein
MCRRRDQSAAARSARAIRWLPRNGRHLCRNHRNALFFFMFINLALNVIARFCDSLVFEFLMRCCGHDNMLLGFASVLSVATTHAWAGNRLESTVDTIVGSHITAQDARHNHFCKEQPPRDSQIVGAHCAVRRCRSMCTPATLRSAQGV